MRFMSPIQRPHVLEYTAFGGFVGLAVYITFVRHFPALAWGLWILAASQLTSFIVRLVWIRIRQARERAMPKGQGFPVVQRGQKM